MTDWDKKNNLSAVISVLPAIFKALFLTIPDYPEELGTPIVLWQITACGAQKISDFQLSQAMQIMFNCSSNPDQLLCEIFRNPKIDIKPSSFSSIVSESDYQSTQPQTFLQQTVQTEIINTSSRVMTKIRQKLSSSKNKRKKK